MVDGLTIGADYVELDGVNSSHQKSPELVRTI